MMKTILTVSLILLLTTNILACKGSIKDDKVYLVTKAIDNPEKKFIKVALLLDTSNSMDGLINQAKAQLWDLVNELSYARCEHESPSLEIALYEYGNDNLPSEEGYIRQVIGFTSDLDAISEKLFSLTTNGGNEFCGQVINTSLNQLKWGKNSEDLKLIFIAGNEPFTQGSVHYKDASTNAKEKDVVVNTIFCGNYEHGINGMWKEGALLTNGDYMAIDHNKEIVQIVTPYDKTILQLNIQLNSTYVPYGHLGKNKKRLQVAQDAEARELDEVVIVKRAISKSSRLYQNNSWDLVDASKDKKFSFDSLKKEELPGELQGKSITQIKNFIREKASKRAVIQKQIQDLNKKRGQYILKEKKKTTPNDLESAMIKAIKKQASKKNYIWE